MTPSTTRTYSSQSPSDTRELGARLARTVFRRPLDPPIVIALSGELGAGKTTLVSGFLRELGLAESARSPTYTLIEPYELGVRTLYHLDLYRLTQPRDLESLAVRDLLNTGSVFLIEWPERGAGVLPAADLMLVTRYGSSGEPQERTIEVQATTIIGKELANCLHEATDEPGVSL